MKKKTPLICTIIMIISILVIALTVVYAKVSMGQSVNPPAQNQTTNGVPQVPPEGTSTTNNNSTNTNNTNGADSNSSKSSSPPEMPSTDSSGSQTPPQMPNGDSSNSDAQTPPDMNAAPGQMGKMRGLNTIEILLIAMGSLGFTGSMWCLIRYKKMDKKTSTEANSEEKAQEETKKALEASIKESASPKRAIENGSSSREIKEDEQNTTQAPRLFSNSSQKAIFAMGTLILSAVLTVAIVLGCNALLFRGGKTSQSGADSAQEIETSATTEISDTQSLEGKTLESAQADTSVVMVSNKGNLTLASSTLNKSSGDSSNTENSEFYGLNAALLVKISSKAAVTDTTITTSASGANAVFATGEDSYIKLDNVTITTTKDSSRGLDATYGGTIEGSNLSISTLGAHCATLATDRGEGTITVTSSKLTTAGEGSPLVYSTGNITLKNSTGTATGSSIAVIEGKNSVTLENDTLTAYGIGRATGGIDNAGVMIYQSMSGDASEGTGTFTAKNSTLEISSKSKVYSTAPMFFSTNTNAVINLENVKLSYGSNILLSASGNDGEWGTKGENGANVTLNATNQTLTGNIVADNISTVTISLKSSTLKGAVNSEKSAKSISLTIDKNSKWNVTATSYITNLVLENNDVSLIVDNGNTIYYDSSVSTALRAKTYTLSGGGTLKPM